MVIKRFEADKLIIMMMQKQVLLWNKFYSGTSFTSLIKLDFI